MTVRLLIPLFLLLSCAFAYGQKSPEDYMEEARSNSNYQGKPTDGQLKQYDSIALADYKYIVEQHPTSTLCLTAYYNIARIYENEHREEEAITTYRTVIAIALQTKSKKGIRFVGNEGSEAARTLCDYHEKRGNYDSALYFLGLYDTVLPMFYGCGNEADAAEQANIIRYADIYLEANRVREAEIALLLRSEPGLLESRDNIIAKLRELFQKYERPGKLKSEMEKAVNNYFLDTVFDTRNSYIDTSIYCNIIFKGAKIRRFYEWRSSQDTEPGNKNENTGVPEPEKIIAFLKKSDLYKMVAAL